MFYEAPRSPMGDEFYSLELLFSDALCYRVSNMRDVELRRVLDVQRELAEENNQ